LISRADVPAPAGTNVVLWAWPTGGELTALRPGDAVSLRPVTEAQTDGQGNFALVQSADTDLSKYADPAGHINFEIRASAPHSIGYAEDWDYSFVGSAADAGVRSATGTAPNFTLKPVHTNQNSSRVVPDQGGVGCGPTTLYKNLGQHYVALGAVYIDTSHVTEQFEYTSGASTNIGVGISPSGTVGSFSAGGTSSVGTSSTTTFPKHTTKTAKIEWAHFSFSEYKNSCSGVPGTTRYTVRAVEFEGAAHETTAASYPAASYCQHYDKTSHFNMVRSKAVTWSSGASLGSPVGFTVTAQSGYTSQASLHFYFGAGRHLCGTKGNPGASPSRLVAKP
jgi:hypothetical protein